jgi:hypothetical protein
MTKLSDTNQNIRHNGLNNTHELHGIQLLRIQLTTIPRFKFQCCGAGAARCHIILVESELQRDATPPPTAPTPNLLFNMDGL